tara:strand:- start:161 stop:2350 length:2190 start_codon:yes stop_codon:yes gene_type:complete
MGTGYTRNDASNNIATGNVINAADLDGEFDAIVTAFGTSGHTHDGTAAEGGPVTVVGPVQDFVVSAGEIKPKTTNTLDIGTASLQFKDMYIDGIAYIDGIGEDVLVATDKKIQLRDTAISINSSTDGQLDIDADGEVEIATGTLDVNATTTDISGTLTVGGTLTASSGGSLTGTWSNLGTVTTVDINGGTVDGAVIGGASAAAGTFTTLTATSLNSTAIGNSSASTGAFTTLTASTNLNVNSSTTITGILDEDNMASDSAAKLATQQSIKAYVDSQVGTADTLTEVLGNGNSTSGTNIVVTSGDSITTNTISETTSASGVTVDSLLIKDGGITAAGTSTFAGQTISNLGTVTTANIDGGTIDGTTIGGASAGAGTFTNLTATSADINGGTIDGATIGGSSAGAGTFTTLAATSINSTPIGNSSASTGAFTTLTATSLNSTAIGNSSASTGAFTTLTASSSLNINSSISVTGVLDEDNMASNSAVKLATQQSIKAYVDSQVDTVDTLAEVLAIGNSTGGTNLVVTSGDVITTNTINETTSASGVTIDGVILKDTSLTTATNTNLDLDPNGSGKVVFKGNATKGAGQFILNCENNSHGIVIKGPPHSAAASYTLTLPNTDGDANQVLKSDGSGTLDWATPFALSNQTLATNGSTNIGSLQVRWGEVSNPTNGDTVSFTSAFSTACLNVQTTATHSGAANEGFAVNTLTTSGFDVQLSDGSVDGFYYLAIGH